MPTPFAENPDKNQVPISIVPENPQIPLINARILVAIYRMEQNHSEVSLSEPRFVG